MITTFFLLSFAALILGSIPLWYVSWRRLETQGSLLEIRERISSPLGLVDVMIMFVTWVFGQLGSAGLAVWFLDIQPDSILELTGSKMAIMAGIVALGQLIATGIGMAIIYFRYRRWEIFGYQPDAARQDTLLGLRTFVMVLPAILLLQWALTMLVEYEHGTLEMLMKDRSLLTIASTWFAAVLVAPVCEEIFFRGVLQSWLQRLGHRGNAPLEKAIAGGWAGGEMFESDQQPANPASSRLPQRSETTENENPYEPPNLSAVETRSSAVPYVQSDSSATWMPLIVSAAVFGLAHVGQGAAPIPLFVFGLALGYLYRQTGSILPCIVLHMGLNGFSMFWFTMQILFPGAEVLPADSN